MKLVELINLFTQPEQLEKLYKDQGLNKESEALLIYMKEILDLESEIVIFEIEETEDNIVFEKDGEQFIQFFPLEYAKDLIKKDLGLANKGYSDIEIAKRLLEYRQKDA